MQKVILFQERASAKLAHLQTLHRSLCHLPDTAALAKLSRERAVHSHTAVAHLQGAAGLRYQDSASASQRKKCEDSGTSKQAAGGSKERRVSPAEELKAGHRPALAERPGRGEHSRSLAPQPSPFPGFQPQMGLPALIPVLTPD